MENDELLFGEIEEEKKLDPSLIGLAKKVIELRDQHAKLNKEAAEIWEEKERLEANLIEQMEILDLKSFRHEELGLISIAQTVFARITDADKAREFFDQEGIADQLLENRLKKEGGQKRLNEIVREYLEKGMMLPGGIDYSSKLTIRRSKS
jgi:uncharacterized protein YqeY